MNFTCIAPFIMLSVLFATFRLARPPSFRRHDDSVLCPGSIRDEQKQIAAAVCSWNSAEDKELRHPIVDCFGGQLDRLQEEHAHATHRTALPHRGLWRPIRIVRKHEPSTVDRSIVVVSTAARLARAAQPGGHGGEEAEGPTRRMRAESDCVQNIWSIYEYKFCNKLSYRCRWHAVCVWPARSFRAGGHTLPAPLGLSIRGRAGVSLS